MQTNTLNAVFKALSAQVRREILQLLQKGPCSISDLAKGVSMSLPALSRHIVVLEDAGLIKRIKRGRTNYCELCTVGLDEAEEFVRSTRTQWEGRLDRLETFLQKP